MCLVLVVFESVGACVDDHDTQAGGCVRGLQRDELGQAWTGESLFGPVCVFRGGNHHRQNTDGRMRAAGEAYAFDGGMVKAVQMALNFFREFFVFGQCAVTTDASQRGQRPGVQIVRVEERTVVTTLASPCVESPAHKKNRLMTEESFRVSEDYVYVAPEAARSLAPQNHKKTVGSDNPGEHAQDTTQAERSDTRVFVPVRGEETLDQAPALNASQTNTNKDKSEAKENAQNSHNSPENNTVDHKNTGTRHGVARQYKPSKEILEKRRKVEVEDGDGKTPQDGGSWLWILLSTVALLCGVGLIVRFFRR